MPLKIKLLQHSFKNENGDNKQGNLGKMNREKKWEMLINRHYQFNFDIGDTTVIRFNFNQLLI